MILSLSALEERGRKKMWMSNIFLAIVAFCAGCLVAGSFLAFISLIGAVPRLAGVTKTIKYVVLYEDFFIWGAVIGNLVSLYRISLPVGRIGGAMYGLFGGIFIGCLVAALSETVTTVPILSRRIKMRKGMPYIVYSLALGKGIGSFIQFFVMSK